MFSWRNLDDLAIERSAKESWNSIEAVLRFTAGVRERLGGLLLQARRITPEQREFCLAEQQKTGEKLGDLLIRHGWLSTSELGLMLALQSRQNDADGPLRLGNILIAMGEISPQQLQHAVIEQRGSHKRLGELLVETGHVQPDQILHGLNMQRKLLKAALTALLSFASIVAPPTVLAGNRLNSVSVGAIVLPSVKLNVLRQTTLLTIDTADIERGYMDVPAGSQIEVKSNSREGFALTFDAMSDLFKTVQITGLGGAVELGTESGTTVIQRKKGLQATSLQLGYRFILSKEIRPGNYSWPIALSARAL